MLVEYYQFKVTAPSDFVRNPSAFRRWGNGSVRPFTVCAFRRSTNDRLFGIPTEYHPLHGDKERTKESTAATAAMKVAETDYSSVTVIAPSLFPCITFLRYTGVEKNRVYGYGRSLFYGMCKIGDQVGDKVYQAEFLLTSNSGTRVICLPWATSIGLLEARIKSTMIPLIIP